MRFARVPIQAAGMDLSKRAMRVLIAITSYADKAGCAYPSQERVASDAGLNARTVRKAVRELIDAGLLSVEGKPQRTDAGTFRGTNTYRIHYAQPEAHGGPHTGGPQGACGDRPTVGLSPEGQGGPPNRPVINIPKEQSERARPREASDIALKGNGAKVAFPSDFNLTECMEREAEEYAASFGAHSIEWRREFDKFRARAIANGQTAADWQAAWSNWVARAIDYAAPKRKPPLDFSSLDFGEQPESPTPPVPETKQDDPEELARAVKAVAEIRDVRSEGLAAELVKERRNAGSPLWAITRAAEAAKRQGSGRDKLSSIIASVRKEHAEQQWKRDLGLHGDAN